MPITITIKITEEQHSKVTTHVTSQDVGTISEVIFAMAISRAVSEACKKLSGDSYEHLSKIEEIRPIGNG